jgi:glycine oxidase
LTSVVVVGGGVIGSAIAWTLARDGASVMLLERDDVAAHASGVAAGMLQPLGESWGRGGFANLGLRSLAMFPEIIADLREHTGIDPEYHESGALSVAFDDDDERDLRERAATWADHGLEWLDAKAVRTAEPRLAPDARGGLWSPREAHARSALLARAFATGAAQRGARVETGVTALGLLREGRRVTGVRTTAGDRPGAEVVLCQGPWAPMGLDWLGSDASWELPVVPVRGQIAAIEAPRPPLYSVIAGAGIYLVPKQDGSLVVGATQEEVGFDCARGGNARRARAGRQSFSRSLGGASPGDPRPAAGDRARSGRGRTGARHRPLPEWHSALAGDGAPGGRPGTGKGIARRSRRLLAGALRERLALEHLPGRAAVVRRELVRVQDLGQDLQ